MLIDAGCNSSFIDSKLVAEMKFTITSTRPVMIKIADGTTMVSKSVSKIDVDNGRAGIPKRYKGVEVRKQ